MSTHDVPRFLHRAGEEKLVKTESECDRALAEGWTVTPVAMAPEPAPPPALAASKPAKK